MFSATVVKVKNDQLLQETGKREKVPKYNGVRSFITSGTLVSSTKTIEISA